MWAQAVREEATIAYGVRTLGARGVVVEVPASGVIEMLKARK